MLQMLTFVYISATFLKKNVYFLAGTIAQVCKSGEISHGDADTEVCTDEEERTSGSLMGQVSSIVVGQILAGIGAAPIMPLAVTYMDDSLDRSSTSIYVGESCFQDFACSRHCMSMRYMKCCFIQGSEPCASGV